MAAAQFLPAEGCNFGIERNIGGVATGSTEINAGQGVVLPTLLMTQDSWTLGWEPETPTVAKSKRKKKRVEKVLINMKQDDAGPSSLTQKEQPRAAGVPEFSGGVSRPSLVLLASAQRLENANTGLQT